MNLFFFLYQKWYKVKEESKEEEGKEIISINNKIVPESVIFMDGSDEYLKNLIK